MLSVLWLPMATIVVKYSDKSLLDLFLTNIFFLFHYIWVWFFKSNIYFTSNFLHYNNYLKFRDTMHFDNGGSFAAYAIEIGGGTLIQPKIRVLFYFWKSKKTSFGNYKTNIIQNRTSIATWNNFQNCSSFIRSWEMTIHNRRVGVKNPVLSVRP